MARCTPSCTRAHPARTEVPAPAPFHFTCRTALMMLAHLVGDLYQPLHAGAIYLDAAGNSVDPDASPEARQLAESDGPGSTSTHGGNSLVTTTENLHWLWDETGPAIYSDAELAAVAPAAGQEPDGRSFGRARA
jgi:hypothetical protein